MRRSAALWAGLILWLGRPALHGQEELLSLKGQAYLEDGDRVDVYSAYAFGQQRVGPVIVGVKALYNAITGATPTGEPLAPGADYVPTTALEDRRVAAVLNGTLVLGEHRVGLEFSRGTERSPGSSRANYHSTGWVLSYSGEFDRRLLTVTAGVSWLRDEMWGGALGEPEDKELVDFSAGFTRVLDPASLVTVNVGYGRAHGYLNDPYRLIQFNFEFLPGLFLPLTFAENRPDEREKWLVFAEYRRRLAAWESTVVGNYRWFADDHGLDSHTAELRWAWEPREWLELEASARFYTQPAADYYVPILDGSGIEPLSFRGLDPAILSAAPYYSADYRLSALDSRTLGLRARFRVTADLEFDLLYERYEMEGRDDRVHHSMYPQAHIWTVGGSWRF